MTFTNEDLVHLKEALLSGAKQVSINGRTVVFQDLPALKQLIAEIELSIAAQEEPQAPQINPNRITASFSK